MDLGGHPDLGVSDVFFSRNDAECWFNSSNVDLMVINADLE
jgi:hypothetical protein